MRKGLADISNATAVVWRLVAPPRGTERSEVRLEVLKVHSLTVAVRKEIIVRHLPFDKLRAGLELLLIIHNRD